MIPFEEAYKTVMNSSFSTGTETIPFERSLNRILAENIISDIDLPPFSKASVDGFACRRSELGNALEIIETIPAGRWPEKSPSSGQCSRIMTGAAVPEGADCVVMVEDTQLLPSGKMKFKGRLIKDNIACKGEDVKEGETVINAGLIVRPQDIAVMASVGRTIIKVRKTPEIAVISSGDELVEPYEVPGISKIRNTNAYQLMAQMENTHAAGTYYGIARDNENETFLIIEKAISENDIVLVTGGVSTGDFDFIPGVFERAGVKILFTRVAVQPGKPTTFGIHKNALVFGLPGNPVSSFIQFEMLVRPLIYRMMGYSWEPVTGDYPLAEKFSRKFDERMAFVPALITNTGEALPVEFHGSGHLSALTYAEGIIIVPVGVKSLEKGKIVSVRQI